MQCDFVISIHALERFEERFPEHWTSDEEIGQLIYRETMEAMEAGRSGHVPPIEIANHNITQWVPGKSLFAWTTDKSRGYVLVEDEEGEMTVATVLVGQPRSQAREKLHHNRSWLRREEKT